MVAVRFRYRCPEFKAVKYVIPQEKGTIRLISITPTEPFTEPLTTPRRKVNLRVINGNNS